MVPACWDLGSYFLVRIMKTKNKKPESQQLFLCLSEKYISFTAKENWTIGKYILIAWHPLMFGSKTDKLLF